MKRVFTIIFYLYSAVLSPINFLIAQNQNEVITKVETTISDGDFASALKDFKNGEARLYSQGGLSPIVDRKNLKRLFKKYKILSYEMGCVVSGNLNEIIEYNEAVFELLNFKYGIKWQALVSPDTVGFEEWKKKQG